MIIPFFIPHSGCPHQCVFCNQKSITGHGKQPDPSRLPETIHAYLETSHPDDRVEVAFFGGSFTALSPEIQTAYLSAAEPFIRTGRVQGIRLSTRPDAVSDDCLNLLKEHHVKTVELGAQSMSDTVLMLSNRGHTARDTVKAVSLLRKYGFEVGLQLMPGLPGDARATFMETVETVITLKPDFVRIYPALVIRHTPLADLFETGQYAPLSLDEAIAWSKAALLRFEAAGISVIRVGLQPTQELERPGTVISGPYHPAFRQLVESSVLLQTMTAALSGTTELPRSVAFLVHPSDFSAAVGQKRQNIDALKTRFELADVFIRADGSVKRRTAKLVLDRPSF